MAPGVEEVIRIMVGLGEGRENREKGEDEGEEKGERMGWKRERGEGGKKS